jgi:hypothetical protein
MEQHPDTAAAWDSLHSMTLQPKTYTDYVVVVEVSHTACAGGC